MGTFPSLSEATQSGVFNVLVTKPDIFNETWEHILPVVFNCDGLQLLYCAKPDIFNEASGQFVKRTHVILIRLQEVFQLCVCGDKTRRFKSQHQHLCLNVTGSCKKEM